VAPWLVTDVDWPTADHAGSGVQHSPAGFETEGARCRAECEVRVVTTLHGEGRRLGWIEDCLMKQLAGHRGQ
jgi:hypothetical protein